MEVYRTDPGSLASLPFGDHDVHIWRASLRQPADVIQTLQDTLSSDELERAARFHFSKDRDAFIVARGILRGLLAKYAGAEARELRFGYESAGKPYLVERFANKVSFNVSHSYNMALYAISRHSAVGVDIEYIRPITDLEQVAANTFSPNENDQLRSLPGDLTLEGFFNCWTRKEAFVKALGSGFSYPLQNFDVSLKPGQPARLLSLGGGEIETARWSMSALQPCAGYAAAVVVEGINFSISHYEWAFTSTSIL
jgi:4'-phosphopantetheinyl transferase